MFRFSLPSAAAVLLCAAAIGCSARGEANVASAQAKPASAKPAASAAPAAAPATAAAPGTHAAPPVAEDRATQIARGKQLVTLGGCGDCHTPMAFNPKLGMPVPQLERMLSGHPVGAPEPAGQPGAGDQGVIGATFTAFRLPFGVVYAANLTPHPEHGLGRWTAEDFIATMRTGHKRGTGRVLLPPMPWQNLAGQPEADLRAMFAFLQSLPPIANQVPAAKVPAEVIAGIEKSYQAMAQGH